MTYEIKPNEQFKSLEIYFSDKPETATREALKALRFRWNPKKSCWYGFADLATLSETLENVTGKKPEENAVVIPEASFVDGGGLYDGWEGGNHCNWNTTKELKEQLKAAFKKCGLKVTIREGGGTWTTSLYFTWTISRSKDIVSFSTYCEKHQNAHMSVYGWVSYLDENGDFRQISDDQYYKIKSENPDEAEKIRIGFMKYEYQREIKHDAGRLDALDALTDEAEQRRQLLKKIITSYNRDCSNSMVDYFDRAFYDHYSLKVID
jgi:hypothetical protein